MRSSAMKAAWFLSLKQDENTQTASSITGVGFRCNKRNEIEDWKARKARDLHSKLQIPEEKKQNSRNIHSSPPPRATGVRIPGKVARRRCTCSAIVRRRCAPDLCHPASHSATGARPHRHDGFAEPFVASGAMMSILNTR